MKFLKRALRDERGATMIMVAIAIVVIFGFAVLAIDMSLVQLAKTQLQNAADAAALAGAVILFTSDGDQGAATLEAQRIAGLNKAVQDVQRPVNIGPEDVTFPGGDSVTVVTHRTEATGDPVTLYFLKVLGAENKGDMKARATAAVFCVSGADCLRPFSPPDRWNDADNDGLWDPADRYSDLNLNGVWDLGEPLTEDHNGNGVWDPAEFYDPVITGYRVPDDIGVQVTLKLSDSNNDLRAEWYYPVRFPPLNSDEYGNWEPGGADYETWIIGDDCPPGIVGIGDQLALEPGAKVGPTNHGLSALIDKDPTAEWDPATGTVINSAYPTSPRVIIVAAFDPTLGVQPEPHKYVTVTKIMVLFVEEHQSGDVVGRFMKKATEGTPDPDCSSGGFLYTVSLVE
jgi:hypothetical protein